MFGQCRHLIVNILRMCFWEVVGSPSVNSDWWKLCWLRSDVGSVRAISVSIGGVLFAGD